MRKKNKTGAITLPDIRQYCTGTINQNSMVLAQKQHMDQWKRIESSEITPHIYRQLIFVKGEKYI